MAKVYTKQNFATNPQADIESMVAMDNAIDAIDAKTQNLPDNGSAIYVTETSANHIKYSDGTMKVWGKYEGTVDVTSQWGDMYVGSHSTKITFPQSFISAPIVSKNVFMGSTTSFIPVEYLRFVVESNGMLGISLMRPTSATDVAFVVHYEATGKWK